MGKWEMRLLSEREREEAEIHKEREGARERRSSIAIDKKKCLQCLNK